MKPSNASERLYYSAKMHKKLKEVLHNEVKTRIFYIPVVEKKTKTRHINYAYRINTIKEAITQVENNLNEYWQVCPTFKQHALKGGVTHES
jgi:hypothetical protein